MKGFRSAGVWRELGAFSTPPSLSRAFVLVFESFCTEWAGEAATSSKTEEGHACRSLPPFVP